MIDPAYRSRQDMANPVRALGGVFGLAIFGAIFASKLAYWMPRLIPKRSAGSLAGKDPLHMAPAQPRGFPPEVHQGLIDAFSNSIHTVFLWAVPIGAAGFLITLLLREIPLRGRKQPTGTALAEDFGMTVEAGALETAAAREDG